MKRALSLLSLVLLLNSCNDGNLTVENISLDNAEIQSCSTNNLIYKLKGNQSLLLDIPQSSFTNEPSLVDSPTVIDINTVNRVVNRFYSGTVSTSSICGSIPPATPIVTDEWDATNGKIQIFTTAIKTTNPDNSTKITSYKHNIVFKNISFSKNSGGTQLYETFAFGDYVTPATTLPFSFDKTLEQCTSSKQIYDYNASTSEALTLDVDPALIVNTVTPSNTPRTGLIGATVNKLTYQLFSGLLTSAYFCTTTIPTTPPISEEWIAVTGVSNISGIIEVTTVAGTSGFEHTIVLKNVTMKKGNSDFKLGDSYIYGKLLTN